MQFVIKGKMAGKQGKIVAPAAVAVTVVFATGLALVFGPPLGPESEKPALSDERTPRRSPPPPVSPRPTPKLGNAETGGSETSRGAQLAADGQSGMASELVSAPGSFEAAFEEAEPEKADYITSKRALSHTAPEGGKTVRPANAVKATARTGDDEASSGKPVPKTDDGTLPSPRFAMVSPVAPPAPAASTAPAPVRPPAAGAAYAKGSTIGRQHAEPVPLKVAAASPEPASEPVSNIKKRPAAAQEPPRRTTATTSVPTGVPRKPSPDLARADLAAKPVPVRRDPVILRAATGDGITQAPDDVYGPDGFADEDSGPSIESIAAALRNPARRDMGSSVSPEAMDWILGRPSRNGSDPFETVATAISGKKSGSRRAVTMPSEASTRLADADRPGADGEAMPASRDIRSPELGRRVPALTRVDPEVLREGLATDAEQREAGAVRQVLTQLAVVSSASPASPRPVANKAANEVETQAGLAPGDSTAPGQRGIYRQTAQGIEVDLPLRVHGMASGVITLVIAGASLDQANVVHGEFRVSLGTILAVLQPQMDPGLYARLQGSSNAATMVSLNDLRAAGIAVGFDRNGDLTLG